MIARYQLSVSLQNFCWFGVITSNDTFVSGDFDDKFTLVIFENFDIALVLLEEFQNFQKLTRAIYPKSSSQTCDY